MKFVIMKRFSFILTACLLFRLSLADHDADSHAHVSLTPRAPPKNLKHTSDKVHGIIMGVTVVLVFPLGAMSRKLLHTILSTRALFWAHVACQTLGLTLLITGFGLGVWVAVLHDEVYNDPTGHVILGTILVGFFLMQPFIGIWHHQLYKASKTNNILRHGHIWFGRILIILAIINGGTGLLIGDNTVGGEKAYGILAGIMGMSYIVLAVLWYIRRSRATKANVISDTSELEAGHGREAGGE